MSCWKKERVACNRMAMYIPPSFKFICSEFKKGNREGGLTVSSPSHPTRSWQRPLEHADRRRWLDPGGPQLPRPAPRLTREAKLPSCDQTLSSISPTVSGPQWFSHRTSQRVVLGPGAASPGNARKTHSFWGCSVQSRSPAAGLPSRWVRCTREFENHGRGSAGKRNLPPASFGGFLFL